MSGGFKTFSVTQHLLQRTLANKNIWSEQIAINLNLMCKCFAQTVFLFSFVSKFFIFFKEKQKQLQMVNWKLERRKTELKNILHRGAKILQSFFSLKKVQRASSLTLVARVTKIVDQPRLLENFQDFFYLPEKLFFRVLLLCLVQSCCWLGSSETVKR